MIRKYREVAYYQRNNLIDLLFYPEYSLPKTGKRRKKSKATSEGQAKLNKKNSDSKLIREVNSTFTSKDIRLDLTYDNEHLPASVEEAEKEMKKYIRRLKTAAKNCGIKKFQYVWVTENGSGNGRLHHHMILTGGIPLDVLAEKWGKGYTTVKPLQFNETGIEALVRYMLKNPVSSGKVKYHSSRNLNQPVKRTRSGRISHLKAERIASFTDFSVIEKLYPGYRIVELSPFYNDVNGGYYCEVKLFKENRKKANEKKQRAGLYNLGV